MRELTMMEIAGVTGAGPLTYTTHITTGLMNNVANATTVGRMVAISFTAGYAVGTWLNNTFDLSTRIVDRIY